MQVLGTSGVSSGRRPRIFYGWWIALSYFVLNFYWGGTLLTGFSVFFSPIRESFGLSSTVTTAIIQVRQAGAIVGSPIVGHFFDRVGPRPLMLIATFTGGGGMALLAVSHSVGLFVLSFAIASVGFAIFIAGTGPAAMATWFVRHRGKAISIILAGATVGAFLVPAIVWMEDRWGWRTALLAIVVGLMVIGVPTSMALRHRPEQYGLRPDGDPSPDGESEGQLLRKEPPDASARPPGEFTFREVMRSRTFWLLAGGHGITSLGSASAMLLVFPHLEEQGFSRTTAGVAVTAMGAAGLAGGLGMGWLSDYLERRYLVILAYVLQAGGMLLLAYSTTVWMLGAMAVLLGVGARASNPLVSSMLADYFGRANFGKVQGVLFSIFMTGTTAGPIAAAAAHDASGSYTVIFAAYGGLAAVSIAAMAVVRAPQRISRTVPG